MAGGAFGDIFGGIGDLFASQGSQTAADLFGQAVTVGGQELQLEKASGNIEEAAAGRQIYHTISTQQAQVAGSGLAESGSALDILRASRQQGSIQQQVIGANIGIQEEGTQLQIISAQAQQAQAQATAEAQLFAGIGGIVGGIGSLTNLFKIF